MRVGGHFRVAELGDHDARALELPYLGNKVSAMKKPKIVQQKHLSSGLRYLLTSYHAKNISFSHFLFLVTFNHINHSCTFS
jgi:hypothetical protein